MTRTSFRCCPACERETPCVAIYTVNGCHIHRCAMCGLGRSEPGEFDAQAYYSADYFSGGHVDGYGDYQGSEKILRREFRTLAKLAHGLVPGGRLLEIGCAYGFFLKEASEHFDVTGIEISREAASACEDAGLCVVNAALDEASLAPLGLFDVIVMLDVIEHLPDPAESLRLCALHLNEGGVLVVTTGDFASSVARIAGKRWRLMTPPQHLWFFTRASLRSIAGKHGLMLESVRRPWKFVPLSLIAFQLRRIGVRVTHSKIPEIGIPVNLFDAMRVVFRKQAA